jgi:methionyl aminopeptidase
MSKRRHRTALLDPPPSPPVRRGMVSPRRTVPAGIPRPDYAVTGEPRPRDSRAVRTPEEIEAMRVAGRVAAEVLIEVGEAVAPGVTTDELDRIGHEATLARGAYPSPLNYRGYPKSLCTSVNEIICHGIPDSRKLVEGDIVNVDVTAYIGGVHGDTNCTFAVGDIDDASRDLMRITNAAMHAGIDTVRPGSRINEIGRAIEQTVKSGGYGVIREFVGHGIGDQFHTSLQIPHYYDPRQRLKVEAGMTFTIEPMISIGPPDLYVWDDDWTAATISGQRTAQFEHTLLVTDDGVEVLTVPADGPPAEVLFAV